MGAEKISFINDVMAQVLRIFYKNVGAALLMAFLFMFFYDKIVNDGMKNTFIVFFGESSKKKSL